MLTHGNYGSVCYHSRQAAEKALKGVLVGLGADFNQIREEHGHKLPSLLEVIKASETVTDVTQWRSLAKAVATFNALCTKYRSPGLAATPRQKTKRKRRLKWPG